MGQILGISLVTDLYISKQQLAKQNLHLEECLLAMKKNAILMSNSTNYLLTTIVIGAKKVWQYNGIKIEKIVCILYCLRLFFIKKYDCNDLFPSFYCCFIIWFYIWKM